MLNFLHGDNPNQIPSKFYVTGLGVMGVCGRTSGSCTQLKKTKSDA